jgi:sugar O-acyltransferase (sialic acid O-acetyltransferase NeuD family)
METPQKLVLLGIGANNTDVLDAVRAKNRVEPTFELLGYLTSDGKPKARESLQLQCLGDFAKAREMPEDVKFIGLWGGVGSFWRLPDFFASLGLPPERFATVVHPMAFVSPQSTVGRGSVILAGCAAGPDARVGDHVGILQNVTLGHDDVIGDYTWVTAGATFSGGVRVGYNCYIGSNATIVNGVKIGDQSLIGAAALIRKDVPDREVWVGNPARRLDSLEGWRKRKGYG